VRQGADWSKFIPSQNKFLATPLIRPWVGTMSTRESWWDVDYSNGDEHWAHVAREKGWM